MEPEVLLPRTHADCSPSKALCHGAKAYERRSPSGVSVVRPSDVWKMIYTCKYGHKHRTETGVEYCHANVPWQEKASQITTTPWRHEGTTEVWSDLGRFRDLFWGQMRSMILRRDRVCQYEGCDIQHEQLIGQQYHYLEVHHIIPRRIGGTDHPGNLISLCQNHHKIQPAHHYDVGLVLSDADLETALHHRIRQARPASERTLDEFF